ncbi:MAG: diphthamide biosynthesis enzyme Dph2 [Candidatus Ranarchaeia archaeon]
MFTIPINDLLMKIPRPLPSRILLQLPEGLQPQSTDIISAIEKASHGKTSVFVTGDPCFGACDLAEDQARCVAADLIIHIGHTPFGIKSKVPVLYYPLQVSIDIADFTEKVSSKLSSCMDVGLATTAQHLHQLDDFKLALEKRGVKAIWGPASKHVAPGQVLGCDYTTCTKIASNVCAFLFIGTGFFHPLGIAFSTGKNVYAYDPWAKNVSCLSKEYKRHRHIRLAAITEAKTARTFGVIISTKPGQQHIETALRIRGRLLGLGKKAVLIVFNVVRNDLILNFPDIDAFIATSCPRIAIDDQSQYHRPILTPAELEVVLGSRGFNDVYPETQKT